MPQRPDDTSLTEWLARAKAENARRPVVRVDGRLSANGATPPADTNGDGDERPRCVASIVLGQHCSRPAADGSDLCTGHAAMAVEKAPSQRGARATKKR
jgi:hypothetical protein